MSYLNKIISEKIVSNLVRIIICLCQQKINILGIVVLIMSKHLG